MDDLRPGAIVYLLGKSTGNALERVAEKYAEDYPTPLTPDVPWKIHSKLGIDSWVCQPADGIQADQHKWHFDTKDLSLDPPDTVIRSPWFEGMQVIPHQKTTGQFTWGDVKNILQADCKGEPYDEHFPWKVHKVNGHLLECMYPHPKNTRPDKRWNFKITDVVVCENQDPETHVPETRKYDPEALQKLFE